MWSRRGRHAEKLNEVKKIWRGRGGQEVLSTNKERRS